MSQGNNPDTFINPFESHDARELEIVSNYAAKEEAEVEKLSVEFKDMGYLRLLWDSKIPEKDKTFYYFFSLSASDREDVLKEIKRYQDFYKELSGAMQKVSNSENQPDNENMNPHLIIEDLKQKLSKMAKQAKLGENATASSSVYDLHRSFIEKHEKLENMIKRVECVALKTDLKKAREGWQKSIQSMDDLKDDFNKAMQESSQATNSLKDDFKKAMQESSQSISSLKDDLKSSEKKYDEMCDKFSTLMQRFELLLEDREVLLEDKRRKETQLEFLLQENVAARTRLETDENVTVVP